MNSIQKLQMEKAMTTARLKAVEDGIESLKSYLRSPKFHAEPHVNVEDIFLRLAETHSMANLCEDEAAREFVTCECGHTEHRHHSYKQYGRTYFYCEGDEAQRGLRSDTCRCDKFVSSHA